jgi:putative transposase
VSRRVSPTEQIRDEIDALFTDDRDLVDVLEEVARLGARLIIQTALEVEVTEFLGRARYQRAASAEDARPGCRNGYCPTTVKTTAGPVAVERPKLRGTTEAFASRLFGTGVTKTNALESLVIAGFVRGLSVRDVEATLADALGAEAVLSKSTVSRVCEAIKEEFTRWRERRLDDLTLDYLFLDASHFKMHAGARAEPVLAAWGITTEGKPVLVALGEGGSESTDAWSDFLGELTARGLIPPLLVISDGASGLINATETVLARSLRQRCLIHRARNVLAKVPARAQDEVKNAYWALFDVDDLIAGGLHPGQRLIDAVQARIDRFAEQYGKLYPSAVRCLLTDREQLTSYLRFPVEHHRRIRHSNFIERTFRRNPPPDQGDRSAAWRDQLPVAGVGRPRPGLPRLARAHHDPARPALAAGPAPPAPRPTHPDPTTPPRRSERPQDSRSRRLTCTQRGSRIRRFTPLLGRHPARSGHGSTNLEGGLDDRLPGGLDHLDR